MQYREVKEVIEGYVQYLAIMQGIDIKFQRNKRYNQFEYWINIDEKFELLLTAEMGDVRNKVTFRFRSGNEFISSFENTYYAKPDNFYPEYQHSFNMISLSVYDISQIHLVLSLFEEIGFFTR